VFDLCKDGFNVEGNEISFHSLLASRYILNICSRPEEHTVYPWIQSFSNHSNRQHHLQGVRVPDLHPATELEKATIPRPSDQAFVHSIPQQGEMSMSAADFIPLYSDIDHENKFDAVATVFFLDTAPNPIRYIETIKHCLRPGGIWTNIGPLLWHFENNAPGSHSNFTPNGAQPSEPVDQQKSLGKSYQDFVRGDLFGVRRQ
jgi:carnosine N-methyltransferase